MTKILSFLIITFISIVSAKNPIIPVQQNMILVNAGTYKMGDFKGNDVANEKPSHEVLVNSFYASKYQTTVGEFRDFINETGYITNCEKNKGGFVWLVEDRKQKYYRDSLASWKYVGYVPQDRQPVTFVSWNDAAAYCNWKSKKEGLRQCYKIDGDSIIWDKSAKGYRLPTEAEWEYIARSGGKDYKYSWGNDSNPMINGKKAANIKDETCQKALEKDLKVWKGYEDGFVYTSPVGSFAPNELGLYDITGNVYEWCWDWHADNYYGESPKDNPTGPNKGVKKVCRNVGYCCPIYQISTTHRGLSEPDKYGENMGFRIAMTK